MCVSIHEWTGKVPRRFVIYLVPGVLYKYVAHQLVYVQENNSFMPQTYPEMRLYSTMTD